MSSDDEGPTGFSTAPPPQRLEIFIPLFLGVVGIALYLAAQNFFIVKSSPQEDLQMWWNSYNQAFLFMIIEIIILAGCAIITYLLLNTSDPRRFRRLFRSLFSLSFFSLVPMVIGSYYIDSPHLPTPKILNVTS